MCESFACLHVGTPRASLLNLLDLGSQLVESQHMGPGNPHGSERATSALSYEPSLQPKCDVFLKELVPRNLCSLQRTGIFLTGRIM